MKKSLTFLLGTILAFAVISCTSKPEATNPEPETKTPVSEEESTPQVTENEIHVELMGCELPDTEMMLLDDFEEGNYWYGVGNTWDQWGSHNLSLTADLSKEWKTNGSYSIKCTMEPATTDTSKQATWCCNTLFDTDLSYFNWCAVDVYNPGPYNFNLSIAVQNGDDWGWDQSTPTLIEPGAQTLLFDLTSFPDEHMENVFCFMIQQAEYETEGTVIYFDNFRLFE